jgi:prolyl-tRNA synthetase
VPRSEFVATIGKLLTEIQDSLFARARALRDENTRTIDNREEFIRYFTPKNEEKPEIHGGFALCHYAEDATVDQLLANLKVTIRCIPLEGQIAGGERAASKCIFTGKPSQGRAVFAKAY